MGFMVVFLVVYGLLKDEVLKVCIVYHMICYLKWLWRLEIINFKVNFDIMEFIV